MANQHVSYRSEFGITLRESGLNRLSAGLRDARPELFAFKTEIPIVAPDGGDPGHVLTLYAVAEEPLAFNLYPIEEAPEIERDGFFIKAYVLFTLTDSSFGSITRMRLQAEAAGQLVRNGDGLAIRLIHKPNDEPWFDIVSLEGDHPEAVRLVENRIEGDFAFPELADPGDGATARSFRAIMNYLITLFLKEGLTRTVTEFPLPDMGQLVEAGPLGKLPGRGIFVRNNTIYLTLGRENVGDGAFPSASPAADIAAGLSEKGLQRVLDAMPQEPIDINQGAANTTLRLTSNNFRISRIKANLRPGHDKFFGQVRFGGDIKIWLQFKVFGRWVRASLPLPIDGSFSQYAGLVLPYMTVVNAGTPKERLELRLVPDQKFLELWFVFIKTNYRGLFRDLFRNLVRSVKDKLVYKKLKKIPIIGWILDSLIDRTADIMAWALGTVFETFMSSALTVIFNTIGRAVLQIMKRQEFTALAIEQSKVEQLTGLTVKSADVSQIEDGRGGELLLKLSLGDGHFPAPPTPTPQPDQPRPILQPDPLPDPSLPDLPEYAAGDYEPRMPQLAPKFPEGETHRFAIEADGMPGIDGTMTIAFERTMDGWRIVKMLDMTGAEKTTAFAEYDSDGRPLKVTYEQEENTMRGGGGSSQSVDFTQAGVAQISSVLGPFASFETSIYTAERAQLDFDQFWIFRLAHCALEEGVDGHLARVELADPMEFGNWARFVPIAIVIEKGYVDISGEPSLSEVYVIRSQDEDGKMKAVVRPGSGLQSLEISTVAGVVRLYRLTT